MKKIWDDRRVFLSTIAIIGLLYIMYSKDKDYGVEVVALAGCVSIVNAWEKTKMKGGKDV